MIFEKSETWQNQLFQRVKKAIPSHLNRLKTIMNLACSFERSEVDDFLDELLKETSIGDFSIAKKCEILEPSVWLRNVVLSGSKGSDQHMDLYFKQLKNPTPDAIEYLAEAKKTYNANVFGSKRTSIEGFKQTVMLTAFNDLVWKDDVLRQGDYIISQGLSGINASFFYNIYTVNFVLCDFLN